MTRYRAGRRKAATFLVVCSILAATLTACTSARDTLGTNASPCFESLIIAADAVHDRGTFAGVHLVSLASFGKDAHAHLLERAGPSVHDVCVVSYRGSYRISQVERPLGRAPVGGVGHYAIVIVSEPQKHLLGTVVRLTQPLRFSHPV
jgi:hypothetical protein